MQSSTFTTPLFDQHPQADDVESYFPEIKVVVDARFATYLEVGRRRTFSMPCMKCAIITPSGPNDADVVFQAILEGRYTLSVPLLHALLCYLGSKEGMKVIAIPEDEDEINLILGYVRHGERDYVYYVEHEFEHGEREIHLHARPVGLWTDDLPRALIVLDENA